MLLWWVEPAYQSIQIISINLMTWILLIVLMPPAKKLKGAMSDIGFVPIGRYYEHPDSPFVVEFPPGPLSVGDEPVRNWSTMVTPLGTFTLITSEDCIKDRLAAYCHWNDRQALDQAVWVANDQVGDYRLEEIEKWAEREGAKEKFKEFIARLQS